MSAAPPNMVEDLYRHQQLGVQAEAAAKRGHELLAKGDSLGAKKALDEADACMKERKELMKRWVRQPRPAVENPEQAPSADGRKGRGRR